MAYFARNDDSDFSISTEEEVVKPKKWIKLNEISSDESTEGTQMYLQPELFGTTIKDFYLMENSISINDAKIFDTIIVKKQESNFLTKFANIHCLTQSKLVENCILKHRKVSKYQGYMILEIPEKVNFHTLEKIVAYLHGHDLTISENPDLERLKNIFQVACWLETKSLISSLQHLLLKYFSRGKLKKFKLDSVTWPPVTVRTDFDF